jgi:Phage protein (N4 Gp49/phage Sf6 gene 66) family
MFKIGDKVYPISKSVGATLRAHSIVFDDYDYLEIVKIEKVDGQTRYRCVANNVNKNGQGDAFLEKDLMFYDNNESRKFVPGTKVRRKSGQAFSNGEHVVTLEKPYKNYMETVGKNAWWIKETGSWNPESGLEIYEEEEPNHEELEDKPKPNKVSEDDIDTILSNSSYYVNHRIFGKQCIVVAQLPSGFTIVGQSACVDPENYVEAIGEELARQDIKDQLWKLEGYLLSMKI